MITRFPDQPTALDRQIYLDHAIRCAGASSGQVPGWLRQRPQYRCAASILEMWKDDADADLAASRLWFLARAAGLTPPQIIAAQIAADDPDQFIPL